MNHNQQTLLAEIAANPHLDAPRLAYADWLDKHCSLGEPGWPENGDGASARAEFIRVQVALAALLPNDPTRQALSVREEELLETYYDDTFAPDQGVWEGSLAEWFVDPAVEARFTRGFADNIKLNELALELLIDKGFPPQEPVLHSLELSDIGIGNIVALALANSPHLANLRSLSLDVNHIGNNGVIAIANSPHVANLHTLSIGSNDLGDAGAIAIANSPHLINLHTLNLGGNYIDNEGTIAIANSPHLIKIRSLSLGKNNIENEGAIAIANSPHLINLHTLNLYNNYIEDEGAIAIVNSLHVANLHILNLSSNDIGDAGAIAIANSPHLINLRSLNLGGTNIGNEGIQAVAASRYLPEAAKREALESLLLTEDRINDLLSASTPPGERPAGVGVTPSTELGLASEARKRA
ncbi:MAG: TIGR02996 domain-containing protein [Fimbriiglobus sp.]